MSTEEVLHAGEDAVISGAGGQFTFRATNTPQAGKGKIKVRAIAAGGFITVILGIALVFFLSGNLIPSAITERLIEETDVQYADAVESKLMVFQQAMYEGDVPSNTAARLEEAGIEVVQDGGETTLVYKGETITAGDFVTAVKGDAYLYGAFNDATYSRAAYWYDDAAMKTIQQIGTNRNNFTADSDFEEVMSRLVGEGSNVNVENVKKVRRHVKDNIYEIVEERLAGGKSQSGEAVNLVVGVGSVNTASDSTTATLNAADSLNKADIMAKEQKSAIFFLAMMENISKMKAGDGNESKINETMNYMFEPQTTEVVDIETGEVITVEGSMMESPSLYAVLADEKVDVDAVKNYAGDRVLKTVENQIGSNASSGTLSGTIVSESNKIKGSIGRYIPLGQDEEAMTEALLPVVDTLDESLVNNGFSELKGISGGEMIVVGAEVVGGRLARASGATTGDAEAIKAYARVTNTILALDAQVDRNRRSPFDITSRNTFLGSIVYKMAVVSAKNGLMSSGGVMGVLRSFAQLAGKSFGSLIGVARADDEENSIMTTFGNCNTVGGIGGEGTSECVASMTFDPSTLDAFNDPGFIAFSEENTELVNGVRKIKKNSDLWNFVVHNGEKLTAAGVMDGGIIQDLVTRGISIPFISDIAMMVVTAFGAPEEYKMIASGEMFNNSTANPEWETYKYAQRYMSAARATENLRAYDGDATSYTNIKYFEGPESPVIALLREYYAEKSVIASN